MSRVLLLMTTKTYRARAFLDAAGALGLPVTVGTDRQQVLERQNPVGMMTLDFLSPDASLSTIFEFSRQYPIDAVIATEDDGALLAASASRMLRLKHNPVGSILTARDKLLSRQAFYWEGLKSPQFFYALADENPERIAATTTYPCVLKPLFLSASRGVIRANDRQEFITAWRQLVAILRRPDVDAQGGPLAKKILIEKFIPGREVAVEGLISEGRLRTLAIFDKPDPLDGPYFEETIYVTPSQLSAAQQAEIRGTVARAARAIGLVHGPLHAELRVNDEGMWMLEIAPRSIGGLCARVLRFDGGRSLERLILEHAIGIDTSMVEREPQSSGVMMIPIPRAGTLREINGQEEARKVSFIEDMRLTIPIGQELVPLPEGNRYLGFLFARAETPAMVESALRTAHGQLEFNIDPAEFVQRD